MSRSSRDQTPGATQLVSGSSLAKSSDSGKKKRSANETDTDNLHDELIDQATTVPVNKEFQKVDHDGNGKIDVFEYQASTRADSRVAKYRFQCVDANMDNELSVEEFSKAQEKPEEIERCLNMMIAYQMIDKNRDGWLSQSELWTTSGGGTQFDSRWAFMIACSDRNGDGKVSPIEFSQDMYNCIEEKSEAASKKFVNFSLTDADASGCANQTELSAAVNMLFGLDLVSTRPPSRAIRGVSRRWMQCVDFNGDVCLSDKEYKDLLDPSPEQSHCIGDGYQKLESDMDFQIMDTNFDGKVSKQEYYNWIAKLDMQVAQQEAEALFNSADTNKNGFIDEDEFSHAGEEYEGDGPGYLLFHQFFKPGNSSKLHQAWKGTISKTWAGIGRQ